MSHGQVLSSLSELPADAEASMLGTDTDTFPHAPSTSRSQQVDHTDAFVHGATAEGAGQSRVGNYGPMTLRHHRLKTFGGWQVKQPFPGIYVWRDPFGAYYVVDHPGTRRVTQGSSAA